MHYRIYKQIFIDFLVRVLGGKFQKLQLDFLEVCHHEFWYARSLSCMSSFTFFILTDCVAFANKICWYFLEFILPSVCAVFSVPLVSIKPQSIIHPPTCLTVCKMFFFFLWNTASFFKYIWQMWPEFNFDIIPQHLFPKYVWLI